MVAVLVLFCELFPGKMVTFEYKHSHTHLFGQVCRKAPGCPLTKALLLFPGQGGREN